MAADELVVGVIFPAKKIGHLRNVLSEAADGVRFVLIDLHDPSLDSAAALGARLGARGVDAVLHKLAHDMVFAALGDGDAARRLAIIREFVALHPEVPIIDPIDSVQQLTDRRAACEMLLRLRAQTPLFRVPRYCVVNPKAPGDAQSLDALRRALDAEQLSLPLICKSVEACATERSHLMSVITRRDELEELPYAAIYQEFVNHSGRLFKGYVLGDLINVAERRSLPNLMADARRVEFDTQAAYPTSEDFHSTPAAPGAGTGACTDAVSPGSLVPPPPPSAGSRSQDEISAAVRAIGERIRQTLGLSLFGFDVIVSDATGEFFVIDVNYFPSYKELDDFSTVLRAHIRRTINARRCE